MSLMNFLSQSPSWGQILGIILIFVLVQAAKPEATWPYEANLGMETEEEKKEKEKERRKPKQLQEKPSDEQMVAH